MLFKFAGSAVCHKLVDRSLSAGGVPLPLCARCAGLYLGFFITFIYLGVKKRLSGNKPPGLIFLSAAVFGICALMIDGATSYIGARNSENLLRLITGVLCGAPLPVLVTLAANYAPEKINDEAIVEYFWEYPAILCVTMIIGMMIYFERINNWFAVSLAVCAGEMAMFIMLINLLIIYFFPKINKLMRYILNGTLPVVAIIISNAVQAAIRS